MSQGVLPSQIRTLLIGFSSRISARTGGGANGQAAALGGTNSGISAAAPLAVPVSVSAMSLLGGGLPRNGERCLRGALGPMTSERTDG